MLRVARHSSEHAVSQSSDAHGFLYGMVGLRRDINTATVSCFSHTGFHGIRVRGDNRCEERREIRFAAAGCEVRGRCVEPNHIREKLERVDLDLVRRRRVPPGTDLGIVERRKRVSPNARLMSTWYEQPEIAGMRRVQGPVAEHVSNIAQRLRERYPLRERV